MSSAMKKKKKTLETATVCKGARRVVSVTDQDIRYCKFSYIAVDATKQVLDATQWVLCVFPLPPAFTVFSAS